MKIQDGKKYIKRNGEISGVVKRICDTTYDFWIPEENFRCYMKNGMISISGYNENDHDLMSEIVFSIDI